MDMWPVASPLLDFKISLIFINIKPARDPLGNLFYTPCATTNHY